MKKEKSVIVAPQHLVDAFNKYQGLETGAVVGGERFVQVLSAKFSNGLLAEICVIINADNTYVQSALYEDGHVVCILEPGWDILEKRTFRYLGKEYEVEVINEKGEKRESQELYRVNETVFVSELYHQLTMDFLSGKSQVPVELEHEIGDGISVLISVEKWHNDKPVINSRLEHHESLVCKEIRMGDILGTYVFVYDGVELTISLKKESDS